MVIIKRDGTKEEFNADKIFNALAKAFKACGYTSVENAIQDMISEMSFWDNITVEEILATADGKSLFGDNREGLVFKRLDGKFSFKAISNWYLAKHANR